MERKLAVVMTTNVKATLLLSMNEGWTRIYPIERNEKFNDFSDV
jgi:hypothetical protein